MSSTDDMKGVAGILGLSIVWGIVTAIYEFMIRVFAAVALWFDNLFFLTDYAYGWMASPLLIGTLIAPASIGFLIFNRDHPFARFSFYAGVLLAVGLSISLALKYDIRPMVGVSENTVWFVAFVMVQSLGSVSIIYAAITSVVFGTIASIRISKMFKTLMSAAWRDLHAFAAWVKKPAHAKAEGFNRQQQHAHQQRQQRQHRRQEKPQDSARNDFDPSRFGGSSMPYGVDKRHKDDAPLWAKIDDLSTTDSEAMATRALIRKRTTKRLGYTGGNAATA